MVAAKNVTKWRLNCELNNTKNIASWGEDIQRNLQLQKIIQQNEYKITRIEKF